MVYELILHKFRKDLKLYELEAVEKANSYQLMGSAASRYRLNKSQLKQVINEGSSLVIYVTDKAELPVAKEALHQALEARIEKITNQFNEEIERLADVKAVLAAHEFLD